MVSVVGSDIQVRHNVVDQQHVNTVMIIILNV